MSRELILANEAAVSVPALIGRAWKPATRRFLEFFTVNIRSASTRAAYGRAAGAFLTWCEDQGLTELREL